MWELFEEMALYALDEAQRSQVPMTPEQKQLHTIMEEREPSAPLTPHIAVQTPDGESKIPHIRVERIPQEALTLLRMSANDFRNKLQRVRCVAV